MNTKQKWEAVGPKSASQWVVMAGHENLGAFSQDNARLIAAAPALHESLTNLVGLAERRGSLHEYAAALADARAVLASAQQS